MLRLLLESVNAIVWGIPTLFFFAGGGILFTVRLRGIQFCGFGRAFRAIFADLRRTDGNGGFSAASALLTSLGAVMGPGNLIGVSSAILIGGSGAVFWMWVSAWLGMAMRYVESVLSVLHRRKDETGNFGGPMYVMRDRGWRRTAAVFAAAGVLLSLTMANALPSGAVGSLLRENYRVSPWISGSLLGLFAAATVFGGGRRIARVSEVLVPCVCLFFIGASAWVMISNPSEFCAAFGRIFCDAFSLRAGIGGLLGTTVRFGLARGIYSNEAGMGTEPILSAATEETNVCRQGLISMTGPFLDTVVFCSFTALIVIMAGDLPGIGAAAMVSAAFSRFLPGCGSFIAAATLVLLVLATLASWAYYGEACLRYFTPSRRLRTAYRLVYSLLPVVGASADLSVLFSINDLLMACMAIPNLVLCLRSLGEVRQVSEFPGKNKLRR